MLSNNQKEKVIEFLNTLKIRNQKFSDDRVERFIQDAFELVENNEYGIAFENTLENPYEFDIRISEDLFKIAKEAIQKMQLNWDDWKFIKELVE